MYEAFFKLQQCPFPMTPDAESLFLTDAHREAMAGLTYAILSRKGFAVLTGDAGTGKTTLLTAIAKAMPLRRADISMVFNPTVTAPEFLEMLLIHLGVSEIEQSKARRLQRLEAILLERDERRQLTVLVVDEAHKLLPEVLEEIRLLTNFENSTGKLLQLILAGQNELEDTLNRVDMRQLKQRIAVRLKIRPLTFKETEEYIVHRWRKAGGEGEPFDAPVVHRIFQGSRGIPRVINSICDNTLLMAFGESTRTVTLEHVNEAIADLDLEVGFGSDSVPMPALHVAKPEVQPAVTMFPTLDRYNTDTGNGSSEHSAEQSKKHFRFWGRSKVRK